MTVFAGVSDDKVGIELKEVLNAAFSNISSVIWEGIFLFDISSLVILPVLLVVSFDDSATGLVGVITWSI